MIRVLVVDDHPVVRAGLAELLATAPDIDVAGVAADGGHAVELARQLEPDVVVMDLSMPVLDGIEATRRIVANRPETGVVVLTSFSDRSRILAALDAGAVGYLLKDTPPEDLIDGIRAAGRGESPLAPKVARTVLCDRSQRGSGGQLTVREREVLSCVAAGLPNKHIARRLGISEKTVKTHLTSVFQRIGVRDRTQAALWAQREGIAA